MTVSDEAGLIARARARDREAQEELVRQYQDQVFRLACGLLGDREEALDATQDALVSMLRSLPGFRGESSLRTWLYRLTTNVCLNRRRQARVRERFSAPLPEDYPHDPGGPEAAMLDRAAAQAVRRHLAALPGPFRSVVVLRELEGLAYEEIAATLGVPLGTVQSRINRGRRMLRDALAAEGLAPARAGGKKR